MAELNFYLAHYYDKDKKQYIPFMYTNLAKNVMVDAESEESLFDALTQIQNARIYISSELFAHIGNLGIHVSAEQMANINTALGEVILHVENSGIHVTPDNKAYWSGGVTTAGQALSLAGQVNETANGHEIRLSHIEDSLFNNITGNPYAVTFDSLSGLNLVKGIWNAEKIRVEC
jgi:hypothetical protein